MAFTAAQRIAVYQWLGYGASYKDLNLDAALIRCQSIADGGIQDDSSAETMVVGYLTELATIDTRIQSVIESPEAYKVDELTVDPARGFAVLCKRGRMLVGRIAQTLAYPVGADVFSSPRYASP